MNPVTLSIVLGLVLLGLKAADRYLPGSLYKGVLVIWAVGPLFAVFYGLTTALYTGWIGAVPAILFLTGWIVTGMGITGGFHRLLTHKAFDAHPAVKVLFLIFGCMAVEGRPIDWASNHLKHHAFADKEGDPHSPVEGFFHAHLGWFFTAAPPDRERYGRSLMKDPIVMFVERTTLIWVLLGFLIPYLIGGWQGLLWGGFIRMAFVNHATFAVNSMCHTFGTRNFETDDVSRNNWFIAFLTFGEGWHNNHHAFPKMPFHGMGHQVDLTSLLIKALAKVGLVHVNSKLVPTPEQVTARKQQLLQRKKVLTSA